MIHLSKGDGTMSTLGIGAGLEIILGTIIALIVAGGTWIVLSRFTKMERYKRGGITVALAIMVGTAFIFDATQAGLDSYIFALFVILLGSVLASGQIKIMDEMRSKKRKE